MLQLTKCIIKIRNKVVAIQHFACSLLCINCRLKWRAHREGVHVLLASNGTGQTPNLWDWLCSPQLPSLSVESPLQGTERILLLSLNNPSGFRHILSFYAPKLNMQFVRYLKVHLIVISFYAGNIYV